MKRTPDEEKLDRMLHNQRITPGGFLGDDLRHVEDIIAADSELIMALGKTNLEIANRMQEITDKCIAAFENEVKINDNMTAICNEAKGTIVCPWPHPGKFTKRLTTIKRTDLGKEISWSDLNIHLIAEHGFFEGKGNPFRLEPDELINMIW